MYFHAPCGVVLYCFVCKLYANKEKKRVSPPVEKVLAPPLLWTQNGFKKYTEWLAFHETQMPTIHDQPLTLNIVEGSAYWLAVGVARMIQVSISSA